MILSQREREILQVIVNDIVQNDSGYSTLTNTQIAKVLDISVFAVRDKVDSLVKKQKIQRVINYWGDDKVFHNRIIFLGNQ